MRDKVHYPVTVYRLVVVVALVLVTTLVLFAQLINLHVLRKDFLQNQGEARHLRVIPLATHRGMITDRHGEPLAISTPVDSVWVHPKEFMTVRSKWSKLAKVLAMKPARIEKLVLERQDKEFIYIKRHIDPGLAQQVMKLGLAGVSLQREYRRYYPAGEVAAHVVGFTNIDDVGQEGLELAYDAWLKSTPGRQRVLKDRLGQTVKHVELIKAPSPGKDLMLSIDLRLQYLTYRELKQAVFKHKAKSGSAVVLDARTGEVLAMVNQPAYNPNNREYLKGNRYRNRAITDTFEPGSTVKPFTIAAALASGKFSPTTMLQTKPGFYRVGKHVVRDIHNYGRIDVSTVLQKSSNVGAAKIAMAIPAESLWRMHSHLGFGTLTGSGFPGEASGLLNHSSKWKSIDQATLAFGYGMSVTPLQLARAYITLASDGILRPISFLRQDEPVPGERVLQKKIVHQVRRMLEKAVTEGGTGTKSQIPGYRVAGKTGTVKKASAGGYSEDRYLSMFVGMVPASEPRLVMVVTLNEPSAGDYYGGEVAAPVFAKVMAGALRLLDIAPDNLPDTPVQFARLEEAP